MSKDEGQGMNSSQETLTLSADGPPEVTSKYSCTSRGDASLATGQRVHNEPSVLLRLFANLFLF